MFDEKWKFNQRIISLVTNEIGEQDRSYLARIQIPAVSRKLDMSGWGGSCFGVLTGVKPTLPLYRLSVGGPAASTLPLCIFGTSQLLEQAQKKNDMTSMWPNLGPWSNYDKICIVVLTPHPTSPPTLRFLYSLWVRACIEDVSYIIKG